MKTPPIQTPAHAQAATFAALTALTAAVLIATCGLASAQTNALHGLNPSGTASMPSAQQQLNQNLIQQRQGFSIRQQIDSNNRLNHTNQINRNIGTSTSPPCPGANTACRN